MRLILRLALVWLVVMPAAAYFGFPHLTAYMQEQTRAQAYDQCQTETATLPHLFDPARPEIAEQYCQCVRDGVTLTRDDMISLIRQIKPTAMYQRIDNAAEKCSERAQNPRDGDAQVIYF